MDKTMENRTKGQIEAQISEAIIKFEKEYMGRGEPEVIETGRQITVGEYSGIKGFRNVYEKLAIAFKDDAEATKILELARYANVHNQRPLVEEELRFIAKYPDIAQMIMTMSPFK